MTVGHRSRRGGVECRHRRRRTAQSRGGMQDLEKEKEARVIYRGGGRWLGGVPSGKEGW